MLLVREPKVKIRDRPKAIRELLVAAKIVKKKLVSVQSGLLNTFKTTIKIIKIYRRV
jgi:hypothetical protein